MLHSKEINLNKILLILGRITGIGLMLLLSHTGYFCTRKNKSGVGA